MTISKALPWRIIFFVLIAAAVAINSIQFFSLDERASARYSALHPYETPDLIELAVKASSNFRDRYGPAIELREVYTGATIIVPNRALNPNLSLTLLSFGRVRKIERGEMPVLQNFDYRPYIIASGDGGRRGRAFAIAAAYPPSGRFFLVRIDARDILIDEALVPGAISNGDL